jgi:hypothetical protein
MLDSDMFNNSDALEALAEEFGNLEPELSSPGSPLSGLFDEEDGEPDVEDAVTEPGQRAAVIARIRATEDNGQHKPVCNTKINDLIAKMMPPTPRSGPIRKGAHRKARIAAEKQYAENEERSAKRRVAFELVAIVDLYPPQPRVKGSRGMQKWFKLGIVRVCWIDGTFSWEPCEFMQQEIGFAAYHNWLFNMWTLRTILQEGMTGDFASGTVLGFEDVPTE